MGLVADQPVDDVDSGLLELLRPLDVVRFVEAGFELDEGGDLLLVARGLDEGAHDRRVAARAVEILLDGDHLGIARRLLDEVDHRGERVIGVVEQHVLLANHLEYPGDVVKGGNVDRDERRVLEVRPVDVRQALKPQQVDRPVQLVHVFLRKAQVLAEFAEDRLIDALLDFKADRGAAPQVAQLFLDLLQEVLGLLLVDVQVAVARDAEGMGPDELVAGEELSRAELDDVAQEDRALRARLGRGNRDQPREDPRHGQDRNVLDRAVLVLVVGALQRDHDVERLVSQLGKGVGLVERQRGQDREDLVAEVCPHPVDLRLREIVRGAEENSLAGERGDELVVPAVVLVLDERGHDRVDAAQLLHRGEAVGAELRDARVDLLHEARHPDLEELIKVRADNREEAHALQKGVAHALRLLKDPPVEGQPAQLPVEVGHLHQCILGDCFYRCGEAMSRRDRSLNRANHKLFIGEPPRTSVYSCGNRFVTNSFAPFLFLAPQRRPQRGAGLAAHPAVLRTGAPPRSLPGLRRLQYLVEALHHGRGVVEKPG